MSINLATMYDSRDANNLIQFAEPIKGMLDHAKLTAFQAQSMVIEKVRCSPTTTYNSRPNFNVFVIPDIRPVYAFPTIGRSEFRPFNVTNIINNTTIINNSGHSTTPVKTFRSNGTSLRPTREAAKEKDGKLSTGERVGIAVIFTAVLGIFSYFAGQQYQRFTGANEDRKEIKNSVSVIKKQQSEFKAKANRENGHLKNLDQVLTLEKGIYGRIQKDAMVKTAIAVGFVVGAAIGVAAALTGLSTLALVAVGVSIAVGAVALFHLGFSNVNKANGQDADKMQQKIYELTMKEEDYGFDLPKAGDLDQIPAMADQALNENNKDIKKKIDDSLKNLDRLTTQIPQGHQAETMYPDLYS